MERYVSGSLGYFGDSYLVIKFFSKYGSKELNDYIAAAVVWFITNFV